MGSFSADVIQKTKDAKVGHCPVLGGGTTVGTSMGDVGTTSSWGVMISHFFLFDNVPKAGYIGEGVANLG